MSGLVVVNGVPDRGNVRGSGGLTGFVEREAVVSRRSPKYSSFSWFMMLWLMDQALGF